MGSSPEGEHGQDLQRHCSLRMPNQAVTGIHVHSCFCPWLCPLGPSNLDPTGQEGATRLTGAFVCLVEMICVPVTLPSLLHCLPLLRRLAAGQRRPVEEAPFHFKVHPSRFRGAIGWPSNYSLKAEAHSGLAPGSVHLLFWSVGDLFTHRSRFLLPTNFAGIEEER